MRRLCTAAALASLCVASLGATAGCTGPAAAPHPAGTSSPSRTPATARAAATATVRPRATQAPPAPRVTVTRMRTADGSVVTVATFSGPLTYVLHDGSQDPGATAGRVRAGPAVRGTERKRLLAVFNGGFKLSAGAGGYEQEGHLASPLRRGLTSLVIDRSGQARIGIWGHGLPAPGEAVYSVRQNLPPLVRNGKPTALSADWGVWGATLGGGEYVARSALGQTAAGTWCTPRACPRPRPTWRSCWPTRAPGPRWSSTSTRNGSSWTWPGTRAARCAPPSVARAARRASSWSAGPGTSSPS